MFYSERSVALSDLWFEPSQFPDRTCSPGDENLQEMADAVETLTKDPLTIARFRVAANAGVDGVGFDEQVFLERHFHDLNVLAVAKAAAQSVVDAQRELRAKGGKKSHENRAPHPDKAKVLEYVKAHPGLSSKQIKMRLGLRASERSISGWKSEAD